jgi:hypothetical protein
VSKFTELLNETTESRGEKGSPQAVVRFYDKGGTAEQRIKGR